MENHWVLSGDRDDEAWEDQREFEEDLDDFIYDQYRDDRLELCGGIYERD